MQSELEFDGGRDAEHDEVEDLLARARACEARRPRPLYNLARYLRRRADALRRQAQQPPIKMPFEDEDD